MITTALSAMGRFAMAKYRTHLCMGRILVKVGLALIRLEFLNHAVLPVIIRQIYFTAVQSLKITVVAALILGSLDVHFLLSLLTGFGAYNQIGVFLLAVVLKGTAPITVSLIVLLRSGTAVVTEVALMKINHEFDTLRMLKIKPEVYVLLPRILAFVLAGPTLSVIFSIIALIGGFFVLGYFHDITFNNYVDQLFYALELKHFIILLIKPMIMCGLIVTICLHRAMNVEKAFTEVPIKLISGMTNSLWFIVVTEVFFTLAG